MSATDAREIKIADSQFGGGATTWAPATWYLGLSTTTPADDGTGFSEPVGGSYARVTCTNNSTNFPPASAPGGVTQKVNGAKFTFPNPTGNWGAITHFGFFTAASGGTPEWVGAIDTTINPKTGNSPVEFDAGELVMTFD